MGIITLLLVIYLTGWAVLVLGDAPTDPYGEALLGKIPVVKFIYNSVKHLSTAVFESNSMFNHVVLVPFHQSKALGFIMADVPQMLKEKLGDDYVCVFVPWSLNMTSGTNLFVRKQDVIYLDISSESALQYMLTAGAVMPQRSTEGAGLTVNPGRFAVKNRAEKPRPGTSPRVGRAARRVTRQPMRQKETGHECVSDARHCHRREKLGQRGSDGDTLYARTRTRQSRGIRIAASAQSSRRRDADFRRR